MKAKRQRKSTSCVDTDDPIDVTASTLDFCRLQHILRLLMIFIVAKDDENDTAKQNVKSAVSNLILHLDYTIDYFLFYLFGTDAAAGFDNV